MVQTELSCVIYGVSGDIGGPLLQPFAPQGTISSDKPNLDVILGITSFGGSISKCGMSQLPSVFTKFGSFLDWIRGATDVR